MRKVYLCNYEVSVYLFSTPPFPAPRFVIPLPPLDCLRFFEAAARHRSFVRAAEELGVTPPAVAHRIRSWRAISAPSSSGEGAAAYTSTAGAAPTTRRSGASSYETTERHGDRRRFRGR